MAPPKAKIRDSALEMGKQYWMISIKYIYNRRDYMMKKSYIIIAFILIAIISGGYLVYNYFFPVAQSIEYPEVEQITSIIISSDNELIEYTDIAEFTAISSHIVNARATRIWSVYDAPTVFPYYTINIETVDNNSRYIYYIYEKNFKVYIEQPYYGVYVIDKKIINFVK